MAYIFWLEVQGAPFRRKVGENANVSNTLERKSSSNIKQLGTIRNAKLLGME